MEEEKRVSLKVSSSESQSAYATIKDDGDLEVGTADTGDIAQLFMGGDHEFWVLVPAKAKDALLLALIQAHFNAPQCIDLFRDFVKKNGIEHKYETWTSGN